MNRPIEFRGKRKDGAWVYGDLSTKYIEEPHIVCNDDMGVAFWHNVDPETIGQYAGLKDKNGNKIFEGDIVKAKSLFGEQKVLEISWHEYLSGWGTKDYSIDDSFPEEIKTQRFVCSGIVPFHDIEIIGNIYENKELLQN